MDSRKDREYFANELRQTIGNGLNELGETAYQVADGALASAELASEVAMLAEAGAPSAGSILRSATTRMSGSAVKQSAAGAARAAEFSHNWQRASLQKAIQRHAGPDATSWTTKTGKTIIENPSTGRQVVVDNAGGYFRIYQPRTIGATKGKYLDMLGKTPAPARYVKNGAVKNIELGADALESATHFLIQ